MPVWIGLGIPILAILVCLPLFWSLTVTVTDTVVRVRFGIGLLRFTFPLEAVQSAEPVTNRWWHGWGIHGWPGKGWVYNVSGWDAVELRMRDGRFNRIGTDEPEKLAAAIQSRLTGR
jgi:hypothetical protein